MKNKILCIVGKSGVGKSTIADYIEKRWNIPSIQSYTTRKPRYEGEKGHIFVSELEYKATKPEEMLAYTNFGGEHYWALHKDVEEKIVYVIDEEGLIELQNKYSERYDLITWFVTNPKAKVNKERTDRDKDKLWNTIKYDDVIVNDNSKETLFMEVDLLLYENSMIEEVDPEVDYEEYL